MTDYPSPPLPPLPELLLAVREIAQRAGDVALGAMAQVEGELKEDMTFVTAADRQVEQFLRRELMELNPDVGFLGEEFGRHGEGSRTWIVDPIDGTNNMLFGVPLWGVSVGLVEEGESILGVYHMPLTHETFYAYKGGGAFVNGERIQAREKTPLHHQDLLGITSVAVRKLDLSKITGYFRGLGSIGVEVVYTAKGVLYGCISMGDKLVDMGATACIAQEAGCQMTYLSGDPFFLGEWMEAKPRKEPLLIGADWAVEELRNALS